METEEECRRLDEEARRMQVCGFVCVCLRVCVTVRRAPCRPLRISRQRETCVCVRVFVCVCV